MEKKLYRVKVVLYVMAENESAACVAATQAKFDIFECAARKADSIDQGWNTAIPYNSDNDLTCAEILLKQQSGIHPIKMPDYIKVSLQAFDSEKAYLGVGQ